MIPYSLKTNALLSTPNTSRKRSMIWTIGPFTIHTVNNGYIEYPKLFDFQGVQNRVAATQKAYENHFYPRFKSLDRLEEILPSQSTCWDTLTEADIRLYVSAIKFDVVYVQHFKCNIGMIRYE